MLNANFFKLEANSFKFLTNGSLSVQQLIPKKNPTIFCFVKTHPLNFKTRLFPSFNNCIKYCTDYR